MIGLVLGIAPVALLPDLPGVSVPLALVIAGLLLLRRLAWPFRFCSGLAIGCALAMINGHLLLYKRLPADCSLLPLGIAGQVASLPRISLMPDGTSRQRFEFAIDTLSPAHCRGPRRALLSYYGAQTMLPGERWHFDLALKKPWGLANPGSFNMQSWYAQSGIDVVGSVPAKGARRLTAGSRLSSWHHRLRLGISEHIAVLPYSPEVLAILRAITVADKSGIDSRLWSLLQQFGVNHLLVISGLHVGLVAGFGYLMGAPGVRLLRLAGLSVPWLPGILALLCCCFYSALAGFSLSTQRALCMLLCFILAALAGRSSGSANNLLLAAAMVLALNPLAVLGSGLWLSFGSVAALLWLVYWQRGRRRWQRLLLTHGFMSLVMVPMGAWWFGGSSLVAGPANLLMVPLVGMLVVPVALLAVVSKVALPAAEPLLWQLAAWPLEQLLPVAQGLAADGQGWLYRQWVSTLPEVLLAVLGVILIIMPAGLPFRFLATLLLLPLMMPFVASSATNPAHTAVTVLDVGQGTAVVVQAGNRALLYDTGGGDPAGSNMVTSVVLPFLRDQGIVALDILVVSHPDNDHSAGTATLLQSIPVTRFLYGGRSRHAHVGQPCVAGQGWHWPGGPSFQFLSPALEQSLSSNDSSCVMQIESAGYRLLLVGDIERVRELDLARYWGDQLRSDWLLVAHHGSRTSSSPAWLKTVRPSMAVLSSGYGNRFGHPHPLVVQRLMDTGSTIYSTADGGALRFDFVPGQVPTVQQYRQLHRRFWM
jgi:competence protein ComEC